MLKGKSLFIAVAIAFTALYYSGSMLREPAGGGLRSVMQATGATVGEFRLSAWSRLPPPGRGEGELAAVVRSAMDRLGVRAGNYRLCSQELDGGRTVRAETADAQQRISVAVRLINPVDGAMPEVYLAVTLQITGGEEFAERAWRTRVAGLFLAAGGEPQITTCLVGWLDGKLDTKQWLNKFTNAGQAVYAAPVDTFVEPDFANVAYFSPVLPDCIRVGYKPVNMNMAMRFSPDDNRTYVIVGSPVIAGEY